MLIDATGEPVSPAAVVRVDVDHRNRVATYLVAREGFLRPEAGHLYGHAGKLLGDLKALGALDSATEGSLVARVERHARTVEAQPNLEAAIGFTDSAGESGLVRITSVRPDPKPRK
ncbi:hypothetical protein ACG04Q_20950 [Roseateles sp. DXS20W]|uniref:Uncharacterized protein n=1 Tax=Pelomonas lactea TaxID=3299030 RepID=A0ABW7GQ35_9BURK